MGQQADVAPSGVQLHRLACELDVRATRAKRGYFWMLRGQYAFTIWASLSAAAKFYIGGPHGSVAGPLLAAGLLCGQLSTIRMICRGRADSAWFRDRMVGEQVTSLSWRYLVRAEPFDKADEEGRREFERRISMISEEVGLAPPLDSSDPSFFSSALRRASMDDRQDTYLQHRFEEQRHWYYESAARRRTRTSVSTG